MQDSVQLYFTVYDNVQKKEIPLKQGGENIQLTNENKHEFIRLKMHYEAYG